MMIKLTKTIGAGLAASALLALSPALASAETTRSYDISGFDEVDVSAGVEVKFTVAPEWSVKAEYTGDEDMTKVRLKGDKLYLSRKNSIGWKNHSEITYIVSAPSLTDIEVSSGSSALFEGLTGSDLTLETSSGATVSAYGDCGDLEVSVSSGATINAKGLECESVDARASSGGSLSAFASESAESKTSSGGSVVIYGDPAVRKSNDSITGGTTRFKSG